jgi:C-terminal binding protein
VLDRSLSMSLDKSMHRVVITDCLEPPVKIEETALAGLARLDCLMAKSTDELVGKLGNADGIILYHEVTLTNDILSELKQCKVIVRGGVGYDNVDIQAAGALGIPVCNVPDYGVDEVADHAIGMMLACMRGFVIAERRLRNATVLKPWDRHDVGPVQRLADSNLGIIGCGRIGSATALRAKALKMRVFVYDPYLRPGVDKVIGVERVSLETLLAESDAISLHMPLTEETRELVNAAALAQMKPTACLINTARGAVVDTTALAEALKLRRIAGAGIDVLPSEPPHTDDPLIQLWQANEDPPINLMITPHTAYYSEAGLLEIREKSSAEVARVLRGEKPWNLVNREWLK